MNGVTDHERIQVPSNVAVEQPRASVVREEPDCDIITGGADAHDVAEDRVHKVVRAVTSATHNSERMSMQVNGMLFGGGSSKSVRPCCQIPAQNNSQVRRVRQLGWSVRRSCSVRDRRRCLGELGPMLSARRSGSGATQGQSVVCS